MHLVGLLDVGGVYPCHRDEPLSHPLVVFGDPGLGALLVVKRSLCEVRRDDSLPLHEDGAAQIALVVRPHQHLRRLVRHLQKTTHFPEPSFRTQHVQQIHNAISYFHLGLVLCTTLWALKQMARRKDENGTMETGSVGRQGRDQSSHFARSDSFFLFAQEKNPSVEVGVRSIGVVELI